MANLKIIVDSKELNQVNKELDNISKSKAIDKSINEPAKKTPNIIQGSVGELRQLTRELRGLQIGSEAFTKTQQKIDDLKDSLNANKAAAGTSLDVFRQLPGPLGDISGSAGSVVDTFKRLSETNKGALGSSFKSLFDDIKQGGKYLANLTGISKLYAITNAAVSTSLNITNTSSKAAAIGARIFSAALVAIPIFAIVAGLVLAYQALDSFFSAGEKAIESADKQSEAIGKSREAYGKQNEAIGNSTKLYVAQAKSRGASQEEINKIELDGLKKQQKVTLEKEKDNKKRLSFDIAEVQSKIDTSIALYGEDSKQVINLKKARTKLQKEYVQSNTNIENSTREVKLKEAEILTDGNNKIRETQKKANEKAIADAKKTQDDLLNVIKKSNDEINQLEKKSVLDSIDNANLKAQETLKIAQKEQLDLLDLEIKRVEALPGKTKEETDALILLRKQRGLILVQQGKETNQLLEEQDKAYNEMVKAANDERYLENISSEELKARETLRIDYENKQDLLKQQLDSFKGLGVLSKEQQIQFDRLNKEYVDNEVNYKNDSNKLILEQTKATNSELLQAQIDYYKNKENLTSEEQNKLLELELKQIEKDKEDKLKKVDEEILALENKKEKDDLETERLKQLYDTRNQIIDTANKKSEKSEEETGKAKIETQYEIAKAYGNLASSIGDILTAAAGKNKKLAKAGLLLSSGASLAQVTINTAEGATKAFKKGLPLGPIEGATIIAAGVAQGVKIVTSTAKGIKDIDAAGNDSAGNNAAPPPVESKFRYGYVDTNGLINGGSHEYGGLNLNVEGGESIINKKATQQFGELLKMINGNSNPNSTDYAQNNNAQNNNAQPIIKTYVVASDVTSQQEFDNKIKRLTTL